DMEVAMSRKVKRWATGLTLLLCLAASVVGFAAWPRSAINEENAARIEVGMDQATVEAILGPSRDESTGPLALASVPHNWTGQVEFVLERESLGPGSPHPIDGEEWVSNTLYIRVVFHNDRVSEHHAIPVRRVWESPLDMLRRLLHL